MNNVNQQKKKVNSKLNKKIITAFLAVLLFLVILVVSLITLASTVRASNLSFLQYRYYIMNTDSQPNIAKRGDLVIAKKVHNEEIQVGDAIVYGDGKFYFCDNIIETKTANGVTKVIIAEGDGIKYQFSERDVSGKVIHTIPELGNIITFLRTPLGIVFFIIFIVCLFLLLRLIFIVKSENKNDKVNRNNTK